MQMPILKDHSCRKEVEKNFYPLQMSKIYTEVPKKLDYIWFSSYVLKLFGYSQKSASIYITCKSISLMISVSC